MMADVDCQGKLKFTIALIVKRKLRLLYVRALLDIYYVSAN